MFFEKIIVDEREIIEIAYNPIIADLIRIREVRITDRWRRVVDEVRNGMGIYSLNKSLR